MEWWLGGFAIMGLILVARVVRSRTREGATPCPVCGGGTRRHEPYLMCDNCQRFVGMSGNIES